MNEKDDEIAHLLILASQTPGNARKPSIRHRHVRDHVLEHYALCMSSLTLRVNG